MTPYDLLRARINELLPGRLELKFGCEVKARDAFGSGFHATKDPSGIFTAIMPDNTGAWLFPDGRGGFCREKKDVLWKWHTVLGAPLTITDVLRALNTPGNYVRLEPDGWLRNIIGVGIIKMPFNLTAPLSDSSNAAACEAVLALLDSKKV